MERFTKEELEKWWHAQCPKCGWDGLSRDCEGGEPIADTGDFNDPICPMCAQTGRCVVVDDYVEPDAQATIAALQARSKDYLEQIELLQGMLVSYRREADTLRTQLANTAEGTDERRT